MSKRTEVAVFEKTIAIAGVRVTRTAMEFEKVDEGTLREAGAFLQAVDACAAWWWGDYLAAYCGYELRAEEQESGALDELTRGDRLKQYTARYAVIAGKEPKTLWHYLSMARFYNSSRRREELTWSHHAEAKEAADGDEAVADNWLDLALKHHWSQSEMRAAIRKTKRADEDERDGPAAQYVLDMELVQIRRWGAAHLPSAREADIAELAVIFREIQPFLEWAAIVGARLQAATPAAKESLPQAA